MSSSYRKARWGIAALAAVTAPAWGQQVYFVPEADLRGEYYTNRGLRPDSSEVKSSEAYKATVQARMGRVTPRSKTEFRPRIIGQEFPDRSVNRLEAFADLRTEYALPKGQYSFMGSYARQDTFNSEYGDAGFQDFDPDEPPPPDVPTGNITSDLTRTKYMLQPGFSHILTKLTSIAGMVQYEAVRYESDVEQSRVGYDSPYAVLTLVRSTGPRTNVSVGPYVSRYKPDNDRSQTDAYGLVFGVQQRWSELSRLGVQLRAESNKTDFTDPVIDDRSSTDWGVEFLGQRQGQVSSLQYSLGRFLRPSGLGSRRIADQIQLQYNRSLSERLQFKTALRVQRDKPVGSSNVLDTGNRDRARVEFALERMFSREWAVTGGYKYAWQDLGTLVDSADNHTFFFGVAYRGLDPRFVRR